ncbi:MAG: hypothetical protein IPJ00_19290 [Saprospirales bacterium]|nr:hypothetical protein [Saprospirales bacterium]
MWGKCSTISQETLPTPYKPTFERFMRANSFGMLCMACQEGAYNRSIVEGVYLKAREQETTMRYISGGYKMDGTSTSSLPLFPINLA